MTAKQVLFVVPDDNDPHMGILIDHDYIICAECGGVFEADEVFIIQTYDSWVNFEDEIADELDLLTAKDIGKKLDREEKFGWDAWKEAIKGSFENGFRFHLHDHRGTGRTHRSDKGSQGSPSGKPKD